MENLLKGEYKQQWRPWLCQPSSQEEDGGHLGLASLSFHLRCFDVQDCISIFFHQQIHVTKVIKITLFYTFTIKIIFYWTFQSWTNLCLKERKCDRQSEKRDSDMISPWMHYTGLSAKTHAHPFMYDFHQYIMPRLKPIWLLLIHRKFTSMSNRTWSLVQDWIRSPLIRQFSVTNINYYHFSVGS